LLYSCTALPVRFPYFPRTPCVRTLPIPPPLVGGDYCVLTTEGWRRAVLLATVSDVQARKLYSLFTTYNVQNTVDRLLIGFVLNVRNEKSIHDPPHHSPMSTYVRFGADPPPPRTLPTLSPTFLHPPGIRTLWMLPY